MRLINNHFKSKINEVLKMDKFDSPFKHLLKAGKEYLATIKACMNELPEEVKNTLKEQWDYLKGLYKIKMIQGYPEHAICEYLLRLPA